MMACYALISLRTVGKKEGKIIAIFQTAVPLRMVAGGSTSVHNVLPNEAYAGVLVWDRRKKRRIGSCDSLPLVCIEVTKTAEGSMIEVT